MKPPKSAPGSAAVEVMADRPRTPKNPSGMTVEMKAP